MRVTKYNCLTFLVSYLLCKEFSDNKISDYLKYIRKKISEINIFKIKLKMLMVVNETGQFCDLETRAHQISFIYIIFHLV